MPRLFDSHCHLYDERYTEYKDELIAEIENSDLVYLVDIGTDFDNCLLIDAETKKYDFCYGTVGIYPEYTEGLTEEKFEELLKLYRNNPKLAAIGEIGLDYHDPVHYPEKEIQKKGFILQIKAAVENDIPVCIHARDADGDVFDILKKEALGKIPVLLHCFSGSAELAAQYVRLGADIALGGPVTFKNSRHAVEVAQTIPLEHLLIETDAPYLTPVPFRGHTNKPFYVEYTARRIAEIRNISYEELAEQTYKNACRFYRIIN